MSKKEKIPTTPGASNAGDQPDEQIIIDLMEKRRRQQDALKKIITSMDKSSDDGSDSNIPLTPKAPGAKERKKNQTKLI